MDAELLLLGRFIKSVELQGKDVTLTIADVVIEELEETKGGVKKKGVVLFKERDRGWVLNRTNVEALKAMWGRDTEAWKNRRVTIYPAPQRNPSTGEMGTAIRVRGSPDLDRDMEFTLVLPRKKPQKVKLLRTGQKAAPKPTLPPPARDVHGQPDEADAYAGPYPPDDVPAQT